MDDIGLLRSGATVVFNRPYLLTPLFMVNMARINYVPGFQNLKLAYYHVTLFAEEISRSGGVDTLMLVASDRSPNAVGMNRKSWEMALTGLPFKIKNFMVAQNHLEGRERSLDSLGFQISRTLEYTTKGLSTEHIAGDSREGFLQILNQKGVSRHHLPEKFDGSSDYSLLTDFVHMRISIEDAMNGARLRAQMLSPPAAMQIILIRFGVLLASQRKITGNVAITYIDSVMYPPTR